MNFDQYQKETARTDSDYSHIQPEDVPKLVHAMGIAGEAGELCDYIKKCIAHGHPVNREKIKKEAGDVLWYLARILADHNMNLSDAAAGNIRKLTLRYPEKFTRSDSIARVDEQN